MPRFSQLALGAAFLLSACATPDSALIQRIDQLEARIQRQEDIEAVERVAFAYGYYMDNALISEVTSLFADETEYCEITGYGRYDGRDGCLSIWNGIIGPALQNEDGHLRFGRLIKHYLLKPVIEISADGNHANGRFDYLGYSGIFGRDEATSQQIGVYRLGFVREDGIWKLSRFSLSFDASNWNDRSFATSPVLRCPRPNAPPPDGPPAIAHPFPEHAVAPFDFVNPVTGTATPAYVNPERYWQGNWDGEFGGPCGPRESADQ